MTNLLHGVKATGYKLGLLINFGEKSLKYKRMVLWIGPRISQITTNEEII